MASTREISEFFKQSERRAFKQAVYAVRDDATALDIVQDSMLKLTEKYGGRPAEELGPLFQRILQNTVRDHFRRQKVRSLWTTLLSSLTGRHDDDDHDPLETLATENQPGQPADPADDWQRKQTLEIIEQAVIQLPERQREAFLLRYWNDMDVAQTAAAMGCSEGSVKTHCSRATHTLAALLREKGIEP